MSASSATAISNPSVVPGGSANQSGPPYLCPTCQTSYSRLEYLRRHERRHADIRPFVCECGKGFSRSDVLSRHKRQCAVILNGGSAGDVSVTSSNGGGTGKGSGGGNKKGANGRANRKNSTTRPNGRKSNASSIATAAQGGDRSDSLHDTPDDDDDDSPPMHQQFARQHPHPQHPHHMPQQQHSFAQPIAGHGHVPPGMGSQAMSNNSFPFPPQPGIGTSVPPPLLPPAPYATDANGMLTGVPGTMNNTQSFPNMIPPHLSSFTNLVNSQHHYPSSPESNGTMSQHSSPRFTARDMTRHGSNGSRFSLRKGGSFDHIGPRATGGMTGTTPNQYAPEFWDALDPAAKNHATDYVSAGGSSGQANLSLADTGTGGIPLSVSSGLNGVTTPRGEPQRFAVSTGPLSPFSSIALSSAMSPYLSAFSNARDTPFVASPSRGIIPGTPGASLNVFDWTMRPPSKPASSSMSKRDSISQQGTSTGVIATEKGTSSHTGANGSGGGRGSSPAVAISNDAKRKYEEDGVSGGGSRKSPKLEHGKEGEGEEGERQPSHDEDQRSAAELLDSLRNAGSRSSQATGSDGGNVSISSVSSDLQPSVSASDISAAFPSVAMTTPDVNQITSMGLSASDANVPISLAEIGVSTIESQPPTSEVKITPTSVPLTEKNASSITEEENLSSNKVKSEPFFDQRNVTAGPEAFLLRLQGGAQEEQAGTVGPATFYGIGTNALDAGGMSLAQLVKSTEGVRQPLTAASISQSSWEALMNVSTGTNNTSTTKMISSNFASGIGSSLNSNSLPVSTPTFIQALGEGGSMSWMMSPGVQHLINTFAPQPGDGGNYFAGSTVLPEASNPKTIEIEQIEDGKVNSEHGEEEQQSAMQIGVIALEKALSDVKNPFYIPPPLFRSCYSIPHWELPPIARLSVLALHAQQNLLKHIPIIHEPTFRLDSTPACLAFAMCMLGRHEHGRMWWAGEEQVPRKNVDKDLNSKSDTNGKKQSIESLFHDLSAPRYDEEDGEILVREIVMAEKADMLLRTFDAKAITDKDRVSVVQALIFFQSARFLSTDARTRSMATLIHPSLITMARKAEMFEEKSMHSKRGVFYTAGEVMESITKDGCDLCYSVSYLPSCMPGFSDEEKIWRKWSELAGRRRSVFCMFVMDTVSCLDAGVPNQMNVQEIDHFPLPSPDTIWRAMDVKSWRKALDSYQGPTMKEALKELFCPSNTSTPFIQGRHGPFARFVLIVILLRGIVHLLEGRIKGVESKSPLSAYITTEGERQGPGAYELKRALIRWRKGWDSDELCMAASGPEGKLKANRFQQEGDEDLSFMGSNHLFSSQTASGATSLMEDALPFYWFSRILLEHANSVNEEIKAENESVEEYEKMRLFQSMLKQASVSGDNEEEGYGNNLQQSPDFGNLLRKAKVFVDRGERLEKVSFTAAATTTTI